MADRHLGAPVSAWIPHEHQAFVDTVGKGNLSAGLRAIIREAFERLAAQKPEA